MFSVKRFRTGLTAAALSLGASSAFAAEGASGHSHAWPCWHGMPWAGYWWIFPLAFFLLMAGMWIYAIRKGARGWSWWCMPGIAGSGRDEDGLRSADRRGESALDVLNKRLARGEIDKREFDEIKSAISEQE